MSAPLARSAAAVVAFLLLEDDMEEVEVKRRKRRVWVRDWVARRPSKGCFATLLRELRNEDPKVYRNFVRMSADDFDYLLSLVAPKISKQETLMRKPISAAAERLALTLRFLATGDNYPTLNTLFRIPVCTISKIIPEVCMAIYDALKDEYLQTPTTTQQWEDIAKLFDKKWNFPNCVGALDGKHVVIKAPPHSGSIFYNYKKTYSIILMALVDADYKFTYINVGCNGRSSDGGVFNACSLAKALENGTLNIPPDQPLPNGLEPVPHVIVADDAFAMRRYMLKPYSQRNLHGAERIFNYRLSRARRISENAFGIASARFRILRKPIELNPEKVTKIVLAICALHNFLMTRTRSRNIYATSVDFDRENQEGVVMEGQWRKEECYLNGTSLFPLQANNCNSLTEYKEIREIFKNYFMTDGELEWQYKHL